MTSSIRQAIGVSRTTAIICGLHVALAVSVAAQTIAITGGKLYPVSSAPIENGTVLIRDGKIVAVGANIAIPEGAQRIDASGKWVTPGIVNPATQLGLVEIGQVADTREGSARPGEDAINAAFTVWDGLNPSSVLLAPARNEGITTAVVFPQGGLIAGQAAIVDIVEGTVSDMMLRSPVAMVAQVGDASSANVASRGELMVRLREVLEDTRSYMRRRADFERSQTRDFSASRLDLEAMIPVVQGRLPFLILADKASDIDNALKLARDYNLKLIVGNGAEAWMVADRLAAAKVPVMAGAMNNIPTSFSTLGQRQDNPALLRRAGVEVILVGTGSSPDAFNVRNIKQEAGNAVAYGMVWDDALRAITLAPAELFGVADRVGSLRAGRDANVVVWSGDPFELSTRVEHVLLRGKTVTLGTSRQDQLMQRYDTLPPRYSKP
ncbi:MAG: amidohydrolase family protein [Anaerolineae bacterium]|nr:amidohydrolase family protein [Gemmatimonadaceae bacterium]